MFLYLQGFMFSDFEDRCSVYVSAYIFNILAYCCFQSQVWVVFWPLFRTRQYSTSPKSGVELRNTDYQLLSYVVSSWISRSTMNIPMVATQPLFLRWGPSRQQFGTLMILLWRNLVTLLPLYPPKMRVSSLRKGRHRAQIWQLIL